MISIREVEKKYPEMIVIAGTETNDDPLAPVSRRGREMVAAMADAAPVEWLPREERYREKTKNEVPPLRK